MAADPVGSPGGPDAARLRAWYAYNWADHGWAAPVAAVLIGPWLLALARHAVGANGTLVQLGPLRLRAEAWPSAMVTVAALAQLGLLPLVGAATDRRRAHLEVLGAACVLGVLVCGALAFTGGGMWLVAGVLFPRPATSIARGLAADLRLLRSMRHCARFVLAYLLFADAMSAVIVLASTFLTHQLFDDNTTRASPFLFELILLIQFVAVGGAVATERLTRRVPARRVLLGALVVWCAVIVFAYAVACGLAVVIGTALCVGARRRPGPWMHTAARLLGAALIGEQISWQVGFFIHHNWTLQNSLPFDLCDITALVGTVACWWRIPVCVELLWFWGLAGTLQAIITPDIETPFPHLAFVDYAVEHLGIVGAAVFLVVGLGLAPRVGAVRRAFALTLAYAAVVAIVNIATHSDYLFLRSPPVAVSLLQYLGPWPWYLVSCTGIALVAFVVLDLPFRPGRKSAVVAATAGVGSSIG